MRLCDFRKVSIIFVLAVALSLAVAASPKEAFVKDVAFSASGRSLEAKITSTESAKFTYFELDGPHRLVVDFHGLKNGVGFSQKTIQAVGVERVRTSYFTAADRTATRIVFDIERNVNYRVIDDGDGIVRIMFSDSQVPFPLDKNVTVPTSLLASSTIQKAEEPTLLFPRLESLSPEVQVAGLQAEAVAV